LTVLIAAKKVSERAPIFNFEAVIAKYRAFLKNHQAVSLKLSKQVFLKLFVDLVHQGFLRCEGDASDILNVNTKISLGFREKDLNRMIEEAKDRLGLPHIVI
jgi:hypothetical protein